MNDFLTSAWILFDSYKTDTQSRSRRNRESSPDVTSSTPDTAHNSSHHRNSFNSNQTRGRDGRWVETGAENKPKSETSNTESSNTLKPKEIPKDVTRKVGANGTVRYTHTTKEKNKLKVEIKGRDGKPKNVDFFINGSFDKSDDLSVEESNRISIKIAKIIQYDASTRKDGEQYEAIAYNGDSQEYAAVRTYAYEKIANFSRPQGGFGGMPQYGIVKDGKIVPDLESLKIADEKWFSFRQETETFKPKTAEQNANEYRQIAENYRKQRKT